MLAQVTHLQITYMYFNFDSFSIQYKTSFTVPKGSGRVLHRLLKLQVKVEHT